MRSDKSLAGQFLLLFCLITSSFSYAQVGGSKTIQDGGKKRKIELLNADALEYDEAKGKSFKRLIGNVAFKHGDVLMNCDSAYLYTDNSMDAFGNVHIRQGDTLNLYGNTLKYFGDTKKADLSGNVKLVDKDITLTTDALSYDMNSNIGQYNTPGKIINKDNVLTSKRGYYYEKSREFFFKDDVKLVNPEYTMTCDTLKYNTVNRISYFLGPTTIVNKENTITCRSGWFDSEKDISQFSRKARIISKEQIIKGDSIYYDRKKGFGKVIGDIEMIDSTEKITITGNYAEHFEKSGRSFVTGKALMSQIYQNDTLYLHGDTLRSAYTDDSLRVVTEKQLEAKKDTGDRFAGYHRILFAYRHVSFYKLDIQGRCDSLVYSMSDSLMRLYRSPVLWTDKNQLTGDTIVIKTGNGKVQDMDIKGSAFIVSQEDSIRFNQISGKKMKGYFTDNKLRKIYVDGNGETVYYAKEKEKYIGVNKATSAKLWIYMEENEVKQITFLKNPDGALHPMNELSVAELELKGFTWRAARRPLNKEDIFKN